jgi:hypothetical protein
MRKKDNFYLQLSMQLFDLSITQRRRNNKKAKKNKYDMKGKQWIHEKG